MHLPMITYYDECDDCGLDFDEEDLVDGQCHSCALESAQRAAADEAAEAAQYAADNARWEHDNAMALA